MGVYSDNLRREVRLEYMRPEQVAWEREQHPYIHVPFGSIEWHGYQNAVGLDALKAHEQLVGLAARAGGVVYPPVFFGVGGGHLGWPSTFMVGKEPMTQLVFDLLHGFERDGYRKAVLLSGHYPNRSEFLDAAIATYRDTGGGMEVLALVENQAPGVGGDHAAKFETSYMLYLHPTTVDMKRLDSGRRDAPGGAEEWRNWMAPEYRGHPCYGLVGIDPRSHANAVVGQENTERLIAFLARWLAGERATETLAAKQTPNATRPAADVAVSGDCHLPDAGKVHGGPIPSPGCPATETRDQPDASLGCGTADAEPGQ